MKKHTIEVRLAGKNIKDGGEFSGYASVFGVLDSYGDVVMPGAFTATLDDHKKNGTSPALLWQHNFDEPIGTMTAEQDDTGLKIDGKLVLDTQRGREAYALLKAGALDGLSFGFIVTDREYRDDGVRLVKSVDLWESSLVTFGANSLARVTEVRSQSSEIKTIRDFEGFLRDAGFSRSDAKRLAGHGWAEQRDAGTDKIIEQLSKNINILKGF